MTFVELREARGLSQRELAILAGVDRSLISRYENPRDTRHPRRHTLVKLARALRRSETEIYAAILAGKNRRG